MSVRNAITLASAFLLALVASAATPSGSAQAQTAVGTAFTYQGRLTDGSGPATGSYDMYFQLYDASVNGNMVGGAQVLDGVAVVAGAFTVQLDFPGQFVGFARWMEISVRRHANPSVEPFVALVPRQPLTPTPYATFALRAANATTADGATSADTANRATSATRADSALVAENATRAASAGTADTATRAISAETADSATTAGSIPFTGVTGTAAAAQLPDTLWKRAGNAGTVAGEDFLGTIDNQPLELKVNGLRVLRIEPTNTEPNLLAGSTANSISAGVVGAVVAGGGRKDTEGNRVTGDFSTVGGGIANRAGPENGTSPSWATVGGGAANVAGAYMSTVAGGHTNSATGQSSAVGGGQNNEASGTHSTVAGGTTNHAIGFGAAVPGGYLNLASGPYSVAAGQNNQASAENSTVAGGTLNNATGAGAAVPGGYLNRAGGVASFAAGRAATASHDGAFVWSDNSGSGVQSEAENQFSLRASGGIRVMTGLDNTTGVKVTPGGGSWTDLSDRDAKNHVEAVDPRVVLESLASITLSRWSYKTQDPSIRHIGPMAQDFAAAFEVGDDDKSIATVDADGVALAAIQGLYQVVQEGCPDRRSGAD